MTDQKKIDLPYFDTLLNDFRQGNTATIRAFGLHVHWGYWQNPKTADGSIDNFALAAENLTQRVYNTGEVADGQSVLDCGCGFGGTIASLNDRFSNMQLIGLNIDMRQLERAKEQVQPCNHNYIEFIEGDACQLPFADNSFDLVLAVECIFHFPSRQRFFQEAQRVLKVGGKLALCDFVPVEAFSPFMKLSSRWSPIFSGKYYGKIDSNFSLIDYQKLAQSTGFISIFKEDITANTLPTYPFLKEIQRKRNNKEAENTTSFLQLLASLRLLRYLILAYQKV